MWRKVKKSFKESLLKKPVEYGGHSEIVGEATREIFLGCLKESKFGKNGVTALTKKNLIFTQEIIASLPGRATLIYPRIFIVKNAKTKPHVDKLRSPNPQYMRILKDYGIDSNQYGLKIDERLYFGKSIILLNDNKVLIPMTFKENKYTSCTDEGVLVFKILNMLAWFLLSATRLRKTERS